MMQQDSAPLRVLYIGGTGTISTSCVRLSVESGMQVFGLNRGHNSAGRELPEGVTWLRGDVTDGSSVASALGDRDFDAVVNFLSYDADDARRSVAMFEGRTRQYVYISSASVYGKPVLRTPVRESTPTHNRFLEYARAKLRAEHELQAAYAHAFEIERMFELELVVLDQQRVVPARLFDARQQQGADSVVATRNIAPSPCTAMGRRCGR